MSNKGKNKKPNNLDLPIAADLKIEICDYIDPDTQKSLIFKLYIKNFLLNKALKTGKLFDFSLFQKNKSFIISEANPVQIDNFMIIEDTNIEIIPKDNLEDQFNKLALSDEKVKEGDVLKKLLEYNIKSNELYDESSLNGFGEYVDQIDKILRLSVLDEGVRLPELMGYRGIVVNGPLGVGKSYLIRKVVSKYQGRENFLNLDLSDLLMKGAKEEYIKIIFKYAKMLKPSVIVIEDFDKLFYSSDDEKKGLPTLYTIDDSKTKLILTLLNEIDSILQSDRVTILTTTTNYDRLENDFKKNGRFDYVINISPPKQSERKQLLQYLAKDFKNSLTDEDFEILADKSHGFVAGDIVQIFKNTVVKTGMYDSTLTKSLLETTLRDIKPISLKDIILDIPKVLWSDIGGNKEVIKKIRQSIEWPLKHPESFKKIGIAPPNVR
jgi:SpoVK/Ycf46/Vps4 family AAA+-type ATPase